MLRLMTARIAGQTPRVLSRFRNVSRNAKPTAKKNCGMIVSA